VVAIVRSGQLACMLPFDSKCQIYPAINAGYFAMSLFRLCGECCEYSVGLIPAERVRNKQQILDRPEGLLRGKLCGTMQATRLSRV
jgi:hypothetical protein